MVVVVTQPLSARMYWSSAKKISAILPTNKNTKIRYEYMLVHEYTIDQPINRSILALAFSAPGCRERSRKILWTYDEFVAGRRKQWRQIIHIGFFAHCNHSLASMVSIPVQPKSRQQTPDTLEIPIGFRSTLWRSSSRTERAKRQEFSPAIEWQ